MPQSKRTTLLSHTPKHKTITISVIRVWDHASTVESEDSDSLTKVIVTVIGEVFQEDDVYLYVRHFIMEVTGGDDVCTKVEYHSVLKTAIIDRKNIVMKIPNLCYGAN